jgi:hypothetical protein
MKNKYIITLLFITVCSLFSHAQDSKSENVILFFNPQYLFTNGVRIDVDFRKSDSNKWWIISPYYYSDGSDRSFLNRGSGSYYNSTEYESMQGYGLGVSRKIFFKAKSTAKGLYVLVGLTYRHFNIEANNYTYVEITGDDGLKYYDLRNTDYTININSYNGSLVLGHQFNPAPRFYIDLYMGFGLRYSAHSSPENATVEYDRGNIDYGYNGTQFIGGGRLGITLF